MPQHNFHFNDDGELLVTSSGGGGGNVNIFDSAGNALDSTAGALNVAVTGGSTANPAAGPTGSAVPADASYTGFDSGGNLVGVSATNPFPSSINEGGNVAAVTAANAIKVDGSAVTQPTEDAADGTPGSAHPTLALQIAGQDGTNLRTLLTSTTGQLHTIIDSAGTITVTGTVAATQSGTWTVGLSAGSNVIGHVITDTGSTTAVTGTVTVAQATAANLNATVTGTVAATQSGTWTVGTATSSTASSPAATSVTSTSSSVLASNAARKEFQIINTDVVTVYIGLGQTPTATAYHIALSPCTTANDGTGGSYISDLWTGAVNAIVASTSGHVVVMELS